MHKLWLMLLVAALVIAACGQAPATPTAEVRPLIISAIPDQDPERLQRLYGTLATYLSEELDVPVAYNPVTDYAASVTAFRVGDLDLVWYGGLTGVQARLQVPGAHAIVQRDIDAEFRSVFIANTASGIEKLDDLRGRRFTFGSESSTSGRLMPQYFMQDAGLSLDDLHGEPGFSGSHDATIQLVEAGTYDAGALNQQIWTRRVGAGEVDLNRVDVFWTTPPYPDYHWVLHPNAVERYGEDFPERVQQAFFNLDPNAPTHQEILDLFGAERFVATEDENYAQIEQVGREVGLIVTNGASQ